MKVLCVVELHPGAREWIAASSSEIDLCVLERSALTAICAAFGSVLAFSKMVLNLGAAAAMAALCCLFHCVTRDPRGVDSCAKD